MTTTPKRSKRKRILIVDDSPTALLMEWALLADEYDILTASDGAQGVAEAIKERPDLVLLDMMMPRLNGIDACRQLREDQRTTNTPIILATTRSDLESVEAGYMSGCSDYIIKPIDGAELRMKIQSLLAG